MCKSFTSDRNRCQPFSYIIGILEEDLPDALQLLQENSESKPLIVELSKYKVREFFHLTTLCYYSLLI